MCAATYDKQVANGSKILLVDDDQRYLLFMTDRLNVEGYHIMSASSGEEALELISRERPDLILLDIMMPGMGGKEVLATLRETHPDIQVVMVTAVDDREEGSEFIHLGAFDYVTKPVDIDYLKMSLQVARAYGKA
jgi:DNA-binding response OmpR family regulator